MSIKRLVTLPDPILREISKPLEKIDSETQKLADDMLETMYDAQGIGLAAVQVGVPIRMLVVDIPEDGISRKPLVVINPEIFWLSEERSLFNEGCLSIPGYYAEVKRPKCIRMRYRDYKGEQKEIEADGILSTCLQHEVDHLNGHLFIDHISKTKRDMVIRKFKKLAKNVQEVQEKDL